MYDFQKLKHHYEHRFITVFYSFFYFKKLQGFDIDMIITYIYIFKFSKIYFKCLSNFCVHIWQFIKVFLSFKNIECIECSTYYFPRIVKHPINVHVWGCFLDFFLYILLIETRKKLNHFYLTSDLGKKYKICYKLLWFF